MMVEKLFNFSDKIGLKPRGVNIGGESPRVLPPETKLQIALSNYILRSKIGVMVK